MVMLKHFIEAFWLAEMDVSFMSRCSSSSAQLCAMFSWEQSRAAWKGLMWSHWALISEELKARVLAVQSQEQLTWKWLLGFFWVYSTWIHCWLWRNAIAVRRNETTHLQSLLETNRFYIWNPGLQFRFCLFFLVDWDALVIICLCCLFLSESANHVLRGAWGQDVTSHIKGVKETHLSLELK